ncbi:hypothetical protein BSKO_06090 [Bryopsis sp. KO-2023]|nr:hypothetical protein BSKO_06090 [Bryopsis sp. KO-2023]
MNMKAALCIAVVLFALVASVQVEGKAVVAPPPPTKKVVHVPVVAAGKKSKLVKLPPPSPPPEPEAKPASKPAARTPRHPLLALKMKKFGLARNALTAGK